MKEKFFNIILSSLSIGAIGVSSVSMINTNNKFEELKKEYITISNKYDVIFKKQKDEENKIKKSNIDYNKKIADLQQTIDNQKNTIDNQNEELSKLNFNNQDFSSGTNNLKSTINNTDGNDKNAILINKLNTNDINKLKSHLNNVDENINNLDNKFNGINIKENLVGKWKRRETTWEFRTDGGLYIDNVLRGRCWDNIILFTMHNPTYTMKYYYSIDKNILTLFSTDFHNSFTLEKI